MGATVDGDNSLYEKWVSNINMCYPDSTTIRNTEESTFYTYAYQVLDENEDVIATLGPVDPSTCQIYCGAIGKTHDPYPVTYVPPADPTADTGLTYSGTPYSVVEWDFMGTGDETKDIFISISDDFSQFYQGNEPQVEGIPHFVRTPAAKFSDGKIPPSGLRGLAVSDISDDGKTELFAAHESTPRLYRYNQTTDRFDDIADSTGLVVRASNSIAGTWGDFNNDGFADLFVSRAPNFVEDPPFHSDPGLASSGSVLLSNVAGEGTEPRVFVHTASANIPDNLGSQTASWNNFDGEPGLDLFVGSLHDYGTGASRLYAYTDSFFTDVTHKLQNTPITMVTASGWHDMNGDTVLDLVLTRHNKPAEIYFNDGAGNFTDGNSGPAPFQLGASSGFSGFVAYDFDNDGDMDFLGLSNSAQRSPVLFNNQTPTGGAPQFQNISSAIGLGDPGYVHGALALDFGNGSGEIAYKDLYLGRLTEPGKFYFKGEPTGNGSGVTNHFVKVRLESSSPTDNTVGIGAKVFVTSGIKSQVQLVDGGSMRGSQSSRDLVFGLGEAPGSVSATVVWPSGIIQTDVPLVLDEMNTIKLEEIQIDNTTVVGKYKIQASGLVDYEFKWDVNVLGEAQMNEVIFNMGAIPSQCQPEEVSITLATSSDVEVTVTANSSGGFTNILTWKNRPCVPLCNIPFRVKSGNSLQSDTSDSDKILQVKICIGN